MVASVPGDCFMLYIPGGNIDLVAASTIIVYKHTGERNAEVTYHQTPIISGARLALESL